jgi:hypothetical protein
MAQTNLQVATPYAAGSAKINDSSCPEGDLAGGIGSRPEWVDRYSPAGHKNPPSSLDRGKPK